LSHKNILIRWITVVSVAENIAITNDTMAALGTTIIATKPGHCGDDECRSRRGLRDEGLNWLVMHLNDFQTLCFGHFECFRSVYNSPPSKFQDNLAPVFRNFEALRAFNDPNDPREAKLSLLGMPIASHKFRRNSVN